VSIFAAFLICNTFLESIGMAYIGIPYHPEVYNTLAAMEMKQLSLMNGARRIALVDSERGIPLAECLLEQYAPERLYPLKGYPKPPYNIDQMFKRKAR
jgi:hypothetical protein